MTYNFKSNSLTPFELLPLQASHVGGALLAGPSCSAVQQVWHIYGSQVQILASAAK